MEDKSFAQGHTARRCRALQPSCGVHIFNPPASYWPCGCVRSFLCDFENPLMVSVREFGSVTIMHKNIKFSNLNIRIMVELVVVADTNCNLGAQFDYKPHFWVS